MKLAVMGMALSGFIAIGGCGYAPGGQGRSNDTFTYYSTPHEPKTLTLIDTRTGERLWSCEVPVGQQLVVRFRNLTWSENTGKDEMRWELMKLGTEWGQLNNSIACPPASSRRLEMTVRAGPEFHPSSTNADAARK